MAKRKIIISKFISYILRHNPAKFNLNMDKNGYANINNVLTILKKKFQGLTKGELLELVNHDPKGRFHVVNDKIRATYGHSIAVEPLNPPVKPPEILYHGTSKQAQAKIVKDGLRPMRRQFVHLSQNKQDASRVGLRHTQKPIILKILAQDAYLEGVEFFKETNTYLSVFIPKKYIKYCQD